MKRLFTSASPQHLELTDAFEHFKLPLPCIVYLLDSHLKFVLTYGPPIAEWE